jgi:OOP family OmpA-OmpF porin
MPDMRLSLKRFTGNLLVLVLAIWSGAATSGCGFVLFGMGTGAFTAAYVAGEVKQIYPNGSPEAVRASAEALSDLNAPVTARGGDEARTTITGRKPDGTPVEIGITRIDENTSEVGVRVGHVGFWDQDASRQIHAAIGERLARKPPVEITPAETPPPAVPKPEPPAPAEETAPPKKKAATKPPGRVGAPPAAAEPDKPVAGVNLERTLFFASGTNALPPREVEKLDPVAAALRAHPQMVVSLHGFSDASGNASQNFLLSVDRAEAVKRYLVERGFPPDQVLVIGHGAARFLGSNDTEAGRRLNRRVEIELHNGQ